MLSYKDIKPYIEQEAEKCEVYIKLSKSHPVVIRVAELLKKGKTDYYEVNDYLRLNFVEEDYVYEGYSRSNGAITDVVVKQLQKKYVNTFKYKKIKYRVYLDFDCSILGLFLLYSDHHTFFQRDTHELKNISSLEELNREARALVKADKKRIVTNYKEQLKELQRTYEIEVQQADEILKTR